MLYLRAPTHNRTPQSGFTLIELSIVIVVIGLLIGGTLAGRHLIRASQLQGIAADAERTIKAVQLFQQKYNALPGDFPTATSLWGTDPGGCPNTPSNTTPKTTTCNGDGDGLIEVWNGVTVYHEVFRAWQHLANAGMIQGAFTGVPGTADGFDAIVGTNALASKLNPGGYILYSLGNQTSTATYFPAAYGHVILFGADSDASGYTRGAIISAPDAYSIDDKVDDGKPNSGTVMTTKLAAAGCLTSDDNTAATYNIATAQPDVNTCSLIFLTGF